MIIIIPTKDKRTIANTSNASYTLNHLPSDLVRIHEITVFFKDLAIIWLVLGAHIVASIIEDKNLFTHEEQERMEACLLEISQKLGVVPSGIHRTTLHNVVRGEPWIIAKES